jgi:carbon-monoxide dehydrogenase large subunit
VVEHRFVNHRTSGTPIEPRCSIADPRGEKLVLYSTTQVPHIARFVLSGILGMPEDKLRVVAPDVGGGFGAKLQVYQEEALVSRWPAAWAAPSSGRDALGAHDDEPPRPRPDQRRDADRQARRQGHGLQGRDHRRPRRLPAPAHAVHPRARLPGHGRLLRDPGDRPALHRRLHEQDVHGRHPRRRAPGGDVLDRAHDGPPGRRAGDGPPRAAPAQLHRQGPVPHETALGIVYDSGDYHGSLDRLLQNFDVEAFRRDQEAKRAEGVYRGVGFSTWVEVCGLAPSRAVGAAGRRPAGRVLGVGHGARAPDRLGDRLQRRVAARPGPGHELRQIAADILGIDPENVEVLHGDTDQGAWGWGTYGSRSLSVGGEAVARAARKVQDKAKRICAALLEAAPEDIEVADGPLRRARLAGQVDDDGRDRGRAHIPPQELPADIEPGLDESAFYDPENFVFPFGAHACVVEVDARRARSRSSTTTPWTTAARPSTRCSSTGRSTAGSSTRSGQALYEQVVYDDQGQLITGTFVTTRCRRRPSCRASTPTARRRPRPRTRWASRASARRAPIAATPAVAAAVLDALKPLGVTELDMPFTPLRVWQAIQAARGNGAPPPASEQGRDVGEHGQGAAGQRPGAPGGRRPAVITAPFDYQAPADLDEAIRLLAQHGDDAKLLAGGHSLLPLMKLRLAAPAMLVDLRLVPGLRGVERETAAGGSAR